MKMSEILDSHIDKDSKNILLIFEDSIALNNFKKKFPLLPKKYILLNYKILIYNHKNLLTGLRYMKYKFLDRDIIEKMKKEVDYETI